VETGKKLKSFGIKATGKIEGAEVFKWTTDDKYFARMGLNGKIHIWESSSMELLGGKEYPLAGVTAYDWSPNGHYFAAYVSAESENAPSLLIFIDPVSKSEFYRRSLFSVKSVSLKFFILFNINQDFNLFFCLKI
jgi:translation initiation factor 3 subunit B